MSVEQILWIRIRIPEQGGRRPATNRPGIAPETLEQNKLKPDDGDEPALNPLKIFAERSLHTAEVVGYIGANMSYWACAQLEANRERLALHCLGLRGFEVYLPRLRVKRITPARKTSAQAPALFPGYCFVWIELQWHAAR
jgi:hypothetical protein